MGRLTLWWQDSRGKLIVVLCVLWISKLLFEFQTPFLWLPLAGVTLSIIIDGLLAAVIYRTRFFSLSSVVTGLLIGLLLDPTGGIGQVAIASLTSAASKKFIGSGSHKHVFNPAAFGVLVASVIFGRPVAWWGSAWGSTPLIILTVGLLPILYRLRRVWMPVTFLCTYFVRSLLFLSPTSALRLTLDPTVFLFALVMVPEPITAVAKGRWRWAWGILVGSFVLLENALGVSFADPLLLALLTANLVGFVVVRNNFRAHSKIICTFFPL